MKDETCTIIENTPLGNHYYQAKIHAPYISIKAAPGNFIMFRINHFTYTPLIRRPFAILKSEPPYIWIYYQVIGQGTHLLSHIRPNSDVQIIGPLGNSFPDIANKNLLLIAGGRGIAPLFSVIQKYVSQNSIYLIYGGKTSADLHLITDLEHYPLSGIHIYSEDASLGKPGVLTQDITAIVNAEKIDMTFSCGPEKMLEQLHKILTPLAIDNYVSAEAMMGCGFGICHSCAIKTSSNYYKKVCSDGPIFKMEELAW
jgi:dihydroorotate dehydrogenase electron transfer subunit